MNEDVVSFVGYEGRKLPFFVSMCGISYCDGSYKIERNHSETNVLEFIITGCGTVCQDDDKIIAEKDDVYYLKKGRRHLYYSDAKKPWIKMWINFEGELADRIAECYGLTEKLHFHAPELKKYFIEMVNIAKSGMSTKNISDEIAVIFLKIVQQLANAEDEISAKSPLAEKIKAYIDNMTSFDTSLDEIAKSVYCSKCHVIREFRSEYGITPYEYILKKRFAAAEAMLKNTAMSVSDIAEKTGFCDAHYFSGYFKKRIGVSPSVYRKKIKTCIMHT